MILSRWARLALVGALASSAAGCTSSAAELTGSPDAATACLPHGSRGGVLVLGMDSVANTGTVAAQVTHVELRDPLNLELTGATLSIQGDPTAFTGASDDPSLGPVSQEFPLLPPGKEAAVLLTLHHVGADQEGSAAGLNVTYEPEGGGRSKTVETITKILVAPQGMTCAQLNG